jgi:hypothetical protein
MSENVSCARGCGRSRRTITRSPGGRPFASRSRPWALQDAGEFGDVTALAQSSVDANRGCPGVLGQGQDRGLDLIGHGEPDRVVQLQSRAARFVPQAVEVVQPCLGRSGAISADQDRLPVTVGVGDLRQRQPGDLDVVRGGVRARVSGRRIPASASFVLSRNARMGW